MSAPFFPLQFTQVSSSAPGLAVYRERFLIGFLASTAYILTSWSSYVYVVDTTNAAKVYGVDESWIYAMQTMYLIANSLGTLIEPVMETSLGIRGLFIELHVINLLGVCISFVNTAFLYQSFILESISFALVGFSQGLVQCPLTTVAGRWFPAEQRTTAVACFLTSNNFGIGIAYAFPGLIGDLHGAKLCIVIFSFVFTIATVLVFHSAPPLPPSQSEKQSVELNEKITCLREKDSQSRWGYLVEYWSWSFTLIMNVNGVGRLLLMNCLFVAASQVVTSFVSDAVDTDFNNQTGNISSWLGLMFWMPNFFTSGAVTRIADYLKMRMDGLTVFVTIFVIVGILSVVDVALVTLSLSYYWQGSFRFKVFFVLLGNICAPYSNLCTDVATDVAHGKLERMPFPVENMILATQMFISSLVSAMTIIICDEFVSLLHPEYSSVYLFGSLLYLFGVLFLFGFNGDFGRLDKDKNRSEATPENDPHSTERSSLVENGD